MTILVPGENCWRIEQANRLCIIVDAADYFVAAKSAMLKAQHSIMLVGWDFDTRMSFERGATTLEGPNRLGRFLKWLVKREPDLHVRVLRWDVGMLASLGRGMMPLALTNLASGGRLQFKLDSHHPVGAAHHQKVVVVDDNVAFCGGIDMTVGRWDTRAHRDGDHRRRGPRGKPFPAWHDATTALDGAAARAIGDMARDRWQAATRERLSPVANAKERWPECLEPSMRDVNVGIARTLPALGERAEVREVEALYLAGIHAARQSIYLESQYLAARRIAEALAARLEEPDGPEVVVVLPASTDSSWLEQEVMDGARARLLSLLWDADHHQRLGVYHPVTHAGAPIYVHAKVMVVDDLFLRVGSSNLNNRSMGFDTECDLAIEASESDQSLRDHIRAVHHGLLAEHLGVEPREFDAQLAQGGASMLAAIEALRGAGRTLRPFDRAAVRDADAPLAENELLDPEQAKSGFGARLWSTLLQLVHFRTRPR